MVGRASSERTAWRVFWVAAALSVALILWESRGNTFFNDEVALFQGLPGGIDVESVLTPHNGHLIAVAKLLYGTAFDTIGPDAVFFRVIGVIGIVVCALLVFVYLLWRVDPLVALAPPVVLLFLGASWEVMLWPLSIATYVFSAAAGIGALLMLERDDRAGDVGACLLLILALACHSIGLAFLVGAAVFVLLRRDRWQLAWVFAVPLALYAIWWLWALKFDQDSPLVAVNAWLIPIYAADSLAVTMGAVTGLSASLSGDSLNPTIQLETGWGRLLAIAAIVAFVVTVVRGKIPRSLWVALAALLALWVLLGLGLGPGRTPEESRYVFPVAVLMFLVAGNAVSGVVFSRVAIAVVLTVAAVGVMTNVRQLHDGDLFLNDYSDRARAELAMLELGGDQIPADFDPRTRPELEDVVPPQLPAQSGPYQDAVERFGSFAYSIDEVLEQDSAVRDGADRFLVSALGVGLAPASAAGQATQDCEQLPTPSPGAPSTREVAPGEAIVLRSHGSADVAVGRFSDGYPVDLGQLSPRRPATLQLPEDGYAGPWRLSIIGDRPVEACPAGAAESA